MKEAFEEDATSASLPAPSLAFGEASPTGESETLPFGSTSSTLTSISSPSVEHVLDLVDALAATHLGDVDAGRHGPGGC